MAVCCRIGMSARIQPVRAWISQVIGQHGGYRYHGKRFGVAEPHGYAAGPRVSGSGGFRIFQDDIVC